MNNLRNLIHENHNILLQNLCSISKISNIAKSKYSAFLLTSNKWVHVPSPHHISTNDLCSGSSKDQRQKSSYFHDCIMNYGSFKLSVLYNGILEFVELSGIFSYSSDFVHHFLDGLNYQRVYIFGEVVKK